MYSKKRLSILLSTVLAMSMLLSSVAFASADFMYGVSPSTQNAVYSIDSVRVNADTGNAPVEITGTDLTTLKSLTEGTIISRFQINQSGSQSLIGLSNGNSGQRKLAASKLQRVCSTSSLDKLILSRFWTHL